MNRVKIQKAVNTGSDVIVFQVSPYVFRHQTRWPRLMKIHLFDGWRFLAYSTICSFENLFLYFLFLLKFFWHNMIICSFGNHLHMYFFQDCFGQYITKSHGSATYLFIFILHSTSLSEVSRGGSSHILHLKRRILYIMYVCVYNAVGYTVSPFCGHRLKPMLIIRVMMEFLGGKSVIRNFFA